MPHLGNICIVVSPLDPRQSLAISEPAEDDHLWEVIVRVEMIQLTPTSTAVPPVTIWMTPATVHGFLQVPNGSVVNSLPILIP